MNYYQQENPTVNINPYQQNIDIIKNFFNKPIVLVNAVFEAIAIPIALFTIILMSDFVTNSYQRMFASSYYNFYNSSNYIDYNFLGSIILTAGIIALIPGVLTTAAKFIIYFKSKNPDPNSNPSSGFTILWILSIVTVCFLGLFCFLLLIIMGIMFIAAQFTAPHYSYSDSAASITMGLFVFLFIILLIVFGVLFFYLINQLRFYGSVRKSLNSIYLKRNGAMIFGVFRIISACLTSFSILFYILVLLGLSTYYITLNGYNYPLPNQILALMAVGGGISIVSGITGGIIAVKYAGYIKNIIFGTNQQFNANVPYSNPVPADSVPVNPYDNAYPQQPQPQPMQNNPYDDIQNENPYANPQQINPQAPQEPKPDNPYQPFENPVQQENNTQAEYTPDKSFCPNCGSHVFRSDMFCNNCGTKLK